VTNEPLLAEMIDRSDVVFHLAAAVGVKLIVEQPVHTLETNVHGTEVVLKHANKKKEAGLHCLDLGGLRQKHRRAVPRNGRPRARPDLETPLGLRVQQAHRRVPGAGVLEEKKLPVVIVRLFNTVGPRQTGQYGMVLPTSSGRHWRATRLRSLAMGTQSRSFTYVGDVVDALVRLAHEPRQVGDVFNIGSTSEVTIGELAARVKKMTTAASPIETVPYDVPTRPDSRTCPDASPTFGKIQSLVGFAPKMGVDDIIRSVVEHVRQR
jgi:UDP-glucose 4-epimerase